MDRKKKRYLFQILILNGCLMLTEIVTDFFLTPDVELIFLRKTLYIIGFTLRPTLIMYFFLLINNAADYKFRIQFVTPITLNVLVLLSAYFTNSTFTYVTDETGTHFVAGPLIYFPFLVCAGYLIMLVVESLKYFKKGGGRMAFAVGYTALLTVVGEVIEAFSPERRVICNLTMISTLIYFLILHFNSLLARQDERARQLKLETMYSQIGHHFIFNALNSIYGLVDKDPQKAKKAIDYFSNYLRVNIDAIGKTGPIPVSEEIKHIESYAWIEKMRFEDELEVVIDAKETNFCVPALSVQPLVENAIKHGIHKKLGKGTVTVKTYEGEDAYVIEVIDDGIGFDAEELMKKWEENQAQAQGRPVDPTAPHKRERVGLFNVKERLNSEGVGDLTIESVPGEGTTARISIFKTP
jgi:anti-sigma regulatory factor (Ser/Thr protein kinase)